MNSAKCAACGGESFTWGIVKEQFGLVFIGNDQSILQKAFHLQSQKVKAKVCDSCGYMQLFAEKGN